MKYEFYLWYDEVTKTYVIGKPEEFRLPKSDILYKSEKHNLDACIKIAQNLNRISS